MTNMILNLVGREERTVDPPADRTRLQEVGPILKFDLYIKRYEHLQFMDLNGIPWRNQTANPVVLNRRTEFPITHALTYLTDLLSSVPLIPQHLLRDTVLRISNFMFTLQSSRAAVIYVKADLAVMNVTTTVQRPPANLVLARRDRVRVDRSMMMGSGTPEAPPLVLPQQRRRRSVRVLKKKYGFLTSETGADDDLGDCTVCLEELDVVGRSWGEELLKMPCSHVFHYQCIVKWLERSDSCPLCRSVIP